MSQDDGVLNTLMTEIIRSPKNHKLRLAYAEALDKRGDHARAKQIRGECDCGDSEPWQAEFTASGADDVGSYRGFVYHIFSSARKFIQHGAGWANRTPLTAVTWRNVAGHAAQLANCAHLQRIAKITIHDSDFADEDAVDLFRSPHLVSVEQLWIGGNSARNRRTRIGNKGLAALAEAAFIPTLQDIIIRSDGRLDSRGVERFLSSQAGLDLGGLHVRYGSVDDGAAIAVADALCCRHLETVSFDCNNIGDAGFAALLTSGNLDRLLLFSMARNRVTAAGVESLVYKPISEELMNVNLSGNDLRGLDPDAVGIVLAENPGLSFSFKNCSIPSLVRKDLRKRFPRRVHL
jgi:uncharacterized protein (TIGR02996 family)